MNPLPTPRLSNTAVKLDGIPKTQVIRFGSYYLFAKRRLTLSQGL
jgi:hypothetical protein